MSFEKRGAMRIDYQQVSYPGSPLRFRGPAADLSVPHVLCVGGTETFGRFLASPYPARLASGLDLPVANMGVPHAGLDLVLGDPAVASATRTAAAIVLQLPGAANMSNRFYKVHPRRNDRFLVAEPTLRRIYPEVDFTEFHFTRHLLDRLKDLSPERFDTVRQDLRAEWRARLARLLQEAGAPVHLLWLARRRPEAAEPKVGLGPDPLFVTADMLRDVAGGAASLTIVADESAGASTAARGMFHGPREEAAARVLPGASAHEEAAGRLASRLRESGADTGRCAGGRGA
jgi:hypothetical protein